jgi:hypothetical protein
MQDFYESFGKGERAVGELVYAASKQAGLNGDLSRAPLTASSNE